MIFLRGYIYDGKRITMCDYKRSIYDILTDTSFYMNNIDKKIFKKAKEKENIKYNLLNRNYISYIESFNIYMERKDIKLDGRGHLTKEGILENIQVLHKLLHKEDKSKLEIINQVELDLGRNITENKLLFKLLEIMVRLIGKVRVE